MRYPDAVERILPGDSAVMITAIYRSQPQISAKMRTGWQRLEHPTPFDAMRASLFTDAGIEAVRLTRHDAYTGGSRSYEFTAEQCAIWPTDDEPKPEPIHAVRIASRVGGRDHLHPNGRHQYRAECIICGPVSEWNTTIGFAHGADIEHRNTHHQETT
jgi:hypothetical protein